jgi:hypothetical protein
MNFADTMRAWIARPFNEKMDLWEWLMFAIVITTVVVAWSRIMRHVES